MAFKKFKRKFFKKSRRFGKKSLIKRSSFKKTKAGKKIELDAPIYAWSSTSDTNCVYTLSSTSALYHWPVIRSAGLPSIHSEQEFINMQKNYAFCKLSGISVAIRRTVMSTVLTGGNILTMAPMAVTVTAIQASTDARLVWDYDNALRIQMINDDSSPKTKYFPLRGSFTANTAIASVALGGSGTWMASNTLALAPYTSDQFALAVVIGFPQTYPFVTANNLTAAVPVATLNVTCYMSFCVPQILS